MIMYILVILMLAAGILTCIYKDLLSAVIAYAVMSLLSSIIFYLLHAPDVAMAEASIGAALTSAVFIIAIKRTARYEGYDNEKDS